MLYQGKHLFDTALTTNKCLHILMPGGAVMRFRVARPARLAAFVVALMSLLLIAGWLAGTRSAACAGQATAQSARGPRSSTLVVSPGDTLWGIAQRFAPADIDPRYAVYSLRELNNLASANIVAGQRLVLPPSWPR